MATRLSRNQVVLLLVVILIGWGAGQVLQRTAPIGRDVSANATAQRLLNDDASPSREVIDPTLTLVVFIDYQCPACKLASAAMDAAVKKDGHVRIVYKDWPIFGAVSEQAARVAIAAERQGLYPAVHTRLMNERRPLGETVMRDAVLASGGNWIGVQSDLRTHAVAIDSQINLNRGDAFRLGIAGTPTYLAGPILVSGGLDETGFTKAFALGRESM